MTLQQEIPSPSCEDARVIIILEQHGIFWRRCGGQYQALHAYTIDGVFNAAWVAMPTLADVWQWLGY